MDEEYPLISGIFPSLCPICLKVIDARIFQEGESVMIEKRCHEHGYFKDLYWSDAPLYRRFMRYRLDGMTLDGSSHLHHSCPSDCGLCENHKTGTLLGNIDVTNRCNLSCPVCFADAGAELDDPTIDQIEAMMRTLRGQAPVPCPAIQFSGGEPTLRKDLPEIVSLAKKMGFVQIQVATNGVILSERPDLCKSLVDSGLSTVYLQFDGVTPEPYIEMRGRDLLAVKLRALDNLTAAGLRSVALVPTVTKGTNDDQLGDIAEFASKNLDVVNAIVYQPVSFTGRIDQEERNEKRITIPDVIALLEEQTGYEITRDDFYPIPSVGAISRLLEAERGHPMLVLSAHPCCGAATYVYCQDSHLIPITRFLDVEGLLEWIEQEVDRFDGSKLARLKMKGMVLKELPKFIDESKVPDSLELKELILGVFRSGTRESLAEFHKKSLFLGIMHFQDPYNINLEKLEWCGIHYYLPDGRVIPFCSYNTIHRAPQI